MNNSTWYTGSGVEQAGKSRALRVMLLLLLLTIPCLGTSVTGKATSPTQPGRSFNGYITWQLSTFATDTVNNVAVIPQVVKSSVVNGSVQNYPFGGALALKGNDILSPQNTYYMSKWYDPSGNLLVTIPYYVSGTSFDIGTAIPTTITVNNISYLAPAGTNVANVFNQVQTFLAINNTYYQDRYATGGDGSAGNPWVSPSGCAGLTEALAVAPSVGATIYARAGYYRFTNNSGCSIVGKSFTWKGDGEGKVFMDMTQLNPASSMSAPGLTIKGALTVAATTLASSITAPGATTMTVNNGAALTPDSWIQIASLTEVWNNPTPAYMKGEWQHIPAGGISGNTVTLDEATWDSYDTTGNTVNINQLIPIAVDISGFTILGPPNAPNSIACIVVQYAADFKIHDTTEQNCNERGWGLYSSVRGKVTNNTGTNYYPTGTAYVGRNYGIIAADVYDLDISHNSFRTGRHGFSLGSQVIAGASVIDRNVRVEYNWFWGDQEHGLDAHGVAEHYSYIGNHVFGGIVFGGQNCLIADNYLYQTTNAPIPLYFAQARSFNCKVDRNKIYANNNSTSWNALVLKDQRNNQVTGGTFTFTNNELNIPAGVTAAGPIVDLRIFTTDVADEIDFSFNKVLNNNAWSHTVSSVFPVIIGSYGGTITKVTMAVNTFLNTYPLIGYSAGQITSVNSRNNTFKSSPNACMDLRNFKAFISTGDIIRGCNLSGIAYTTPITGASMLVDGLDLQGVGQTVAGCATPTNCAGIVSTGSYNPVLSYEVRNSSLVDTGLNLMTYGIYDRNTFAPDNVFEFNNTITNAQTAAIFPPTGPVCMTRFNGGLNRICRAIAVPASGTWAAGDIVYNSPLSGNLTNGLGGWINIVPGTPGTWANLPLTQTVTFANLPGSPTNGMLEYCTDCTVTTPASCTNVTNTAACTCAASGTGAYAKRINGVWLCN